MQNKKFGYARVSMGSQDLALQLDALKAAGVSDENIFIEKLPGKLSKTQRPQLEACFKKLQEGDTLVVWKLDRLGRSLKDLINLVQELDEAKVRNQTALYNNFLRIIGGTTSGNMESITRRLMQDRGITERSFALDMAANNNLISLAEEIRVIADDGNEGLANKARRTLETLGLQ